MLFLKNLYLNRLNQSSYGYIRITFVILIFADGSAIINTNTRISEAQSYGQPIIMHDAASTGAINYINLAREIIERNNLNNDFTE